MTEHERFINEYCRNVAHKPMTNEEWLKQANTEQLAKVLLSFCQYPCEICKIECDDGGACTYNKALNMIVECLKQPHTVKEQQDERQNTDDIPSA